MSPTEKGIPQFQNFIIACMQILNFCLGVIFVSVRACAWVGYMWSCKSGGTRNLVML